MEAPRPLSGSRRHRRARHLARGLRLGALTLALLATAAAPAGAAAGPGVEVVGPTGSEFVSASAIKTAAQGEPVREYVLRGTPGESAQTVPRQGVPVGKVLKLAGVNLGVGYFTIPRPNGTVAYLPAADFAEPSPFENELPAVISTDEDSIRFLRPLFASEPEGVNAEDSITTPSGEALVVGVHGGSVVEVGVSASTTSTTAGSEVRFTATVPGRSGFDFTWSFGDGATAEGETVFHAFSGSGTYLVRATAFYPADESGGESKPLEVVVGDPPVTTAPGASTTPPAPSPTGAPGTGGKGQGGKGAKPRPSGGGKEGSGAPGKSGKSKGDSPVRQSNSPRHRSASPEPSRPSSTPPEAVPAPAPLPASPEEPTPITPEGEAPAEAAVAPTPAPSPPEPAPSATTGRLVEGELVGDDLGPTSVEEAPGGSSGGQGSRSAAGAVGDGGVGVPVGALIVVALLAGGALFEWRRGRPSS